MVNCGEKRILFFKFSIFIIKINKEDIMEVKKDMKIEDKKSNLLLENRKKLTINGVIEVINFNENQILLNTDVGTMIIKGQELKMNKLDVQNGDVIITGKLDSFVYTSSKSKVKKDSIVSRLFR